jgi:hypothetical protein
MGDATPRNVPGRRLFAVRWSSQATKRLPSRARCAAQIILIRVHSCPFAVVPSDLW